MTYGKDFWCVCPDGTRSDSLLFPKLQPFFYEDGDGGWYVLEDFSVDLLVGKVWYRVTVKAGFDYDGASIPRACRTLVGDKMAHDIIVAALFHDIWYCVHHAVFPKTVADAMLGAINRVYGGSWAKEHAVVSGVALAGWTRWPKTAAEIAQYDGFLIVEEVA